MAEVKQFSYSSNGTEIEFMQGFINLICGLDTDITCEDASGNATTAAAQFADLTSASKASFFFNFGNTLRIEFRRGATNNANSSSYTIYNNTTNIKTMNFTSNANIPTASATRTFFVGYTKSGNVICLWLGQHNVSALANATYSLIRVKTSNDNYLGNIGSSSVMTSTLYNANSSATFVSALPYYCQSGYIDYIGSAKFVSGGTKQFETSEIYSCSTISSFSSIALPNGKNYFAIGTNSIVEVDPST